LGSIILSIAVVAAGIVIGLLRGGSIDALASVRPKWWGLVAGGFVAHAVAESFDVPGALSLSVIGTFALIVGLMANGPTIKGAIVTAFGLSMNLLALVLNGAVPIRFEALSAAGIVEPTITVDEVASVGHLLELETVDSRLGFLGDVIPIAVLSSVISIGDLVTFAGVIVIVSGLMAARRRVGVDVDDLFAPVPAQLTEILDLDAAPPASTATDDDVIVVVDGVMADGVANNGASADGEPIDLTIGSTVDLQDPDDLWADEPDEGVRILGPTSSSS